MQLHFFNHLFSPADEGTSRFSKSIVCNAILVGFTFIVIFRLAIVDSGRRRKGQLEEEGALSIMEPGQIETMGQMLNPIGQVDYESSDLKALVPVPQPKDDMAGQLVCADGETSPASTGSLAATNFEGGSVNRDVVLAKLNQEKTLSLIKAWEDNTKAKSLNRYNRTTTKITAWESAKKAEAEAKLRSLEEKLEKKKAAYVEKMKNEIAFIHRKAEEERAHAEAQHGEDMLKAEEIAAKYRASGRFPRKFPFRLGG